MSAERLTHWRLYPLELSYQQAVSVRVLQKTACRWVRMRPVGVSSHYQRNVSGPQRPKTGRDEMSWTKPEAVIIAVTLEVTAYAATLRS